MEQVQQAVDPKIRMAIRDLKTSIKTMSEDLGLLKQCRKTKKPRPDKALILAKHGINEEGSAWWRIPSMIDTYKHNVTTALLLYGELRGKPHTIREPERYNFTVGKLREQYQL